MIGAKFLSRFIIRKRFHSGFTVMEMLVVVFIFSISMAAVINTYINFTRHHRKLSNYSIVSQDMRYLSELMSRDIRNSRVMYVTNPLPPVNTRLDIQTTSGKIISFSYFNASSSVCSGLRVTDGCIGMFIEDEVPDYIPLTGQRVNITDFRIHVVPLDDPFEPLSYGVYASDRQPTVTVSFNAEYIGNTEKENVVFPVQFTTVSRVYVR